MNGQRGERNGRINQGGEGIRDKGKEGREGELKLRAS